MSKKLKVTVLVDEGEILKNDPEFRESLTAHKTEYHVAEALRNLGHNVSILPAVEDIAGLINSLKKQAPDVVFNLTEHLAGDRHQDKNIAAILELLGISYTGSGPTGLMLCRDKVLCKQLLSRHKIHVPDFASFPFGRSVKISKKLRYPLVVKPAFEDGSEGISNLSIVADENALRERIRFVHEKWQQPAIAEEYIQGRELYVSIIGNNRLLVFPVRECLFDPTKENGPEMATYRVKWNEQYRQKWGIRFDFGELDEDAFKKVGRICKRAYRALQLRDYGRIDLRLTPDNKVVILEVNPNPDIAYGEEFAESAEKTGIKYEKLIERILNMSRSRGV